MSYSTYQARYTGPDMELRRGQGTMVSGTVHTFGIITTDKDEIWADIDGYSYPFNPEDVTRYWETVS